MRQNNTPGSIENLLNEHGKLDFTYLHSLKANGSPEALEKLTSIAEDLNVEHSPRTSAYDWWHLER